MKMRLAALLLLALALAAFAAIRPASASPSPQLRRVLWTLQDLSDANFQKVVYWSRNGAGRPFIPSSPDQHAEVQILDLPSNDGNAVLSWLRGNGRNALYNRGASDSDIGSRRPANMPGAAPSPTPNPYRLLNFASSTIGNASVGHVQLIGGFAAVKRDGRAAIVCISFRNTAQRVANRIVFEFPLTGPRGAVLGELTLDRRGEFTPGIDINGWPSLSDWQGGIGHRGYGDNCSYVEQGIASQPLLQAAGASYVVKRVDYDDGTSWPR